MKLRELQCLVVVAEELHFGRAALRLGMAQPQLSEQIRRMESSAGVSLFVRRPRILLTPAGEVMVAMARRMLAELSEGMARAKAVAAGLTGRVTIGFSPPAMCSDLPQLLRKFLAEHPNVELKLVEGTTGPLRNALEAGELDLIVVREAIWEESFKTARFARDEINLALPESHPLAGKSSIKAGELAAEEFILFPRSSAPHYHDRIMSWCKDIGLQPIISRETDSWIAVLSMIGAGFGLSLGTKLLSRIPFPGVVYRDLDAPVLDVGFWISWAPDRVSPSAERLLRHVEQQL